MSTAVIEQHEYDELIFGGFICLTCTPEIAYNEDPDQTVMWPCPTLRETGVTDADAIAHIKKQRAEIEQRHAAQVGGAK